MKQLSISISIFILAIFSTNICKAAFPIKAGTTSVITIAPGSANMAASSESVSKKQIKTLLKTHKNDMLPQGVYIVLSIFFLGWLAMGINDGWEGYDWVISLILYILFWLPGFIYSLIMMSKYY